MNPRDIMLALIVVVIWGANFTVIKLGLAGVSPMLLGALRYTLTAVPAIAFVRPPRVKLRYLIAYGLTVGLGQFGCLFYAMHLGMPAGIASVALQSQAFFTLFFAAAFLKEPFTRTHLLGLITAGIGLYFVSSGGNPVSGDIRPFPAAAVGLTLAGALFWGLSNIIVRRAAKHAANAGHDLNMFSLVVWSALIPPLPFLILAIEMEQPSSVIDNLLQLNPLSIFAVLYLALAATLFGFGSWSWLLARYHAGRIASFSLLVPVAGLATAYLVLDEVFSLTQLIGCFAVLLGMLVAIGSVRDPAA